MRICAELCDGVVVCGRLDYTGDGVSVKEWQTDIVAIFRVSCERCFVRIFDRFQEIERQHEAAEERVS